MDDSGQRQIVEIMSGGMRQRPGLPPSRHAGIDQFLVASKALIRAKAQLLSHSRSERIDYNIGTSSSGPVRTRYYFATRAVDTEGNEGRIDTIMALAPDSVPLAPACREPPRKTTWPVEVADVSSNRRIPACSSSPP